MSAWDSNKTAFIYRKLKPSRDHMIELNKTGQNFYNSNRGLKIIKTSDLSLSTLSSIDPDVIGSGRFSTFSFSKRRNK